MTLLIYAPHCTEFVNGKKIDQFTFTFTDKPVGDYIGIIYHYKPNESTYEELKSLYNTRRRCFVVVGDYSADPEVTQFISSKSLFARFKEDIFTCANEDETAYRAILAKYQQWKPLIKYVPPKILEHEEVKKCIYSISILPQEAFALSYIYEVLESSITDDEVRKHLRSIGNLIFVLRQHVYDHTSNQTPLFQHVTLHDNYVEVTNRLYQYPRQKIFKRKRYEELFKVFWGAVMNAELGRTTEVQHFLLRGHPGIGKTSLIYYFIGRIQEEQHNLTEPIPAIVICKGKKGATECDYYLVDPNEDEIQFISIDSYIPKYVICDTYNYKNIADYEPAKVFFMVSSPDEANYTHLTFPKENLLFIDRFDKGEIEEWVTCCLPEKLQTIYFKAPQLFEKYGNVTRHIYLDLVMKQFEIDYWKTIYEPTILNLLASNGMTSFIKTYGPMKWNPDPNSSIGHYETNDTSFSHYILTYHFILGNESVCLDNTIEPSEKWSDVVSEYIMKTLIGLATIPVTPKDRKILSDLYNEEGHSGLLSDIIWIQLLLYDLFHQTAILPLFLQSERPLKNKFGSAVTTIGEGRSKGFVVIFRDTSGSGIKIIGPNYVVSCVTQKTDTFSLNPKIFQSLHTIQSTYSAFRCELTHYIISKQKIEHIHKSNLPLPPVLAELDHGIPEEDMPNRSIINYVYEAGKENGSFLLSKTFSESDLEEETGMSPTIPPPDPRPKPQSDSDKPLFEDVDVENKKPFDHNSFYGNVMKLNALIPYWTIGNAFECSQIDLSISGVSGSAYVPLSNDEVFIKKAQTNLRFILISGEKKRNCYTRIFEYMCKSLKSGPNKDFSLNFLVYGDLKIGKTTLCKYLFYDFIQAKSSIFLLSKEKSYYCPKSTGVIMRIMNPKEICEEDIDVVISDNVLLGEDDYSNSKCVILVTNKYDVITYKTFRSKRAPIELYIPFLDDDEMNKYLVEKNPGAPLNMDLKANYYDNYGYHPFPFFTIMDVVPPVPCIEDITIPSSMTPPSSSKWDYDTHFYIYQSKEINKIEDTLQFRSHFFGAYVFETIQEAAFFTAYDSYTIKSLGEDYETMILFFLKNIIQTSEFVQGLQLVPQPNFSLSFYPSGKVNYPLKDYLKEGKCKKLPLLSKDPNGLMSFELFPRFPTIDCVLRCDFVDIMIQITKNDRHNFIPTIYEVFRYIFHRNIAEIQTHLDNDKTLMTRFCKMIGYIPIKERIKLVKQYETMSDTLNSAEVRGFNTLLSTFDVTKCNRTSTDLENDYNTKDTKLKCSVDDYLHYFVNCLLTQFNPPFVIPEDAYRIDPMDDLRTFSPELFYLIINNVDQSVTIEIPDSYKLELPPPFQSMIFDDPNYPVSEHYLKFVKKYRMKIEVSVLDTFHDAYSSLKRSLPMDDDDRSIKKMKAYKV